MNRRTRSYFSQFSFTFFWDSAHLGQKWAQRLKARQQGREFHLSILSSIESIGYRACSITVMVFRAKSRLTLLAWTFYLIFFLIPPEVSGASLACRALFGGAEKDLAARAFYSPKTSQQIQTYLNDTINGIGYMRGENGLARDTMWVKSQSSDNHSVQAINVNTSPSNIAVDILIQTELLSQSSKNAFAEKALSKILNTLTTLQRHTPSGLFFSWYETSKSSDVASPAISSIDNLHLAVALWTIKETFSGTPLAQQAKSLLDPMNLSMFYDEAAGLIGGNFRLSNGQWVRDSFNYSNLGSETRLLYTAGWALGFFKDYQTKSDFLTKAFSALKLEMTRTPEGPLLRLWNGSAFQLYFPGMFTCEESLSPHLKQIYLTMGNHMVADGQRRQLLTPGAFSPGVLELIKDSKNQVIPVYNDMSGNKDLVSTDNQDLKDPNLNKIWDSTFAPYALIMAAAAQPEILMPILKNLENLKSGNDSLYIPGLGWMDGLRVAEPAIGKVIPAQLAINQGMIALSFLKMQARDRMTASARAMYRNPRVKERLKIAYGLLDQKINEGMPK